MQAITHPLELGGRKVAVTVHYPHLQKPARARVGRSQFPHGPISRGTQPPTPSSTSGCVAGGFEGERERAAAGMEAEPSTSAPSCRDARVGCRSRRLASELLGHCAPYVRALGDGQPVESESLERMLSEALWVSVDVRRPGKAAAAAAAGGPIRAPCRTDRNSTGAASLCRRAR